MDIERLTADLESQEGFRSFVYDDANGMPIVPGYTVIGSPTIGYGCLLSKGGGITNAEGLYLLSNRISSSFQEATQQDWWPFVSDNEVRSRAMVDIVFNLGIPRLNEFVNALNALRQRDYVTAAAEFKASKWNSEVGWRATLLEHMIETGQDL